jgi:hypothetical protein
MRVKFPFKRVFPTAAVCAADLSSLSMRKACCRENEKLEKKRKKM